MTVLTTENFNYTNVKSSIKEWSKEELVKLAIFSSELVIDLYNGDSNPPKRAIQKAKDWLRDQTESNAATAVSYATHADHASVNAVLAAAYASHTAASVYSTADDCATAVSYAIAASYAAGRNEDKQKITDYINSKNNEQFEEEPDWENGDECILMVNPETKESQCGAIFIAYHPHHPVVVVDDGESVFTTLLDNVKRLEEV